jgi:hypothetical protein
VVLWKGLNLPVHQYYDNLMVALRRNEPGDRLPNPVMESGEWLDRASPWSEGGQLFGWFLEWTR